MVTDLGTEFGVEVSKEGTTTSHVFRGTVNVRTAAGVGRPAEVVLRRERVDAGGESRRRRRAAAGAAQDGGHFRVASGRRLAEPPKVLDLLDIVAGGDGTGHRRERGIDRSPEKNVRP